MADAAVEFLLENLQQLLLYRVHLIKGAKEQVERLERDVRLFKSFLKDSTKKRLREDSFHEHIRRIRNVVYEAEDAIDAFVTQATESRPNNYCLRAIKKPVNLLAIAREVERVAAEVKEINFANFNVGLGDGDGGPEEYEIPVPRQQNVVGFEDEAEKLIGYIREETDELDVISIIGMAGLGKTTLAGKIFNDPDIQSRYPLRVWVYVSQEFTKKKVFLDILSELNELTEDMHQKTEMELAQLVASILKSPKFLIVMDDVWTKEDWDKLKIALPMSNTMGKVVITSRHEEVAWHVNRNRVPHNLRFLTQEESRLLLQKEVFGRADWPSSKLQVLGKVIAEQCGMLPLAVVVIGGILIRTLALSTEMSEKERALEKVSQSVHQHLNGDTQKRMERILALSYDKLPFHLRACFLYFGMFPKDFEIPAWKLIRMWIAEGFIQSNTNLNLEETAESYLEELISRNLVRVDKRKPDGKVKTCRIHDMLLEFCKSVAGNGRENFLQEMRKNNEGVFQPPISNVEKCRRLCIHSNFSDFVSSCPLGSHVRSFVCFSKDNINLATEKYSFIPAAFKLLRVLEVKPIKFTNIPTNLYRLVHLRYITLSFNLSVLPSTFSKLWNIQTLIVDTTSHALEVRVDIWKLLHLRHLKTNASTTLSKISKSSKEGEQLQTLGTISPQNCRDEVFDKCCNLKTLGIRGQLSLLLDGKTGSFTSLGRLENVERLKLVNDVYPNPPSEVRLRALPPTYQFPPKLRILSLADTFLDWTQMSTLGLLENLEVLKLKDNAFNGLHWIADDGGFRKLEVLHIGRTDLVSWQASAHHFPRLRCLKLQNCVRLQDIPMSLADIPSFHLLDLYHTQHAAASARRIQEIKVTLKLSIFPPINDH